MTPIRFVCACEKGHLQDIDWKWACTAPKPCHEPMWLEEKGTSADPADTSVVCACGKQLSLQELFIPGRLGNCRGERLWLLDRDPDGCDQRLKLLTRTATNTYFPQGYTVISLPTAEDELTKLVESVVDELADIHSVQDLAAYRRLNSKIGATFHGHLSTPEQDCIVFRSKDASMMPSRMPSSTGSSRGRQVGVRSSLGVSGLLRRERRLL